MPIQAYLKGSLSEFSALILIVLAMERYVSSVYPFSYTKVCSTQVRQVLSIKDTAKCVTGSRKLRGREVCIPRLAGVYL